MGPKVLTNFIVVVGSGVSFYTKTIPDYRPEKFAKVPPGKITMILLIELYLEWLLEIVPLDTKGFVVITNICPNPAELNAFESPPSNGCQLTGAVVNVPGQIDKLEDIVCKEFKFSYFVDGVMTGKINTDGLPKFSQHMAVHYQAMEEAYRKVEKDHLEDPRVVLPKYKPPQKAKKVKGSTTKAIPGFSYFERLLKNAYTFPGPGEERQDSDESVDYEKHDLSRTFLALLEQNAIESVKFRSSTLKDIFAGDCVPKAGIGSKLLTQVRNKLDEQKMLKNNKRKNKRQFDSPNRGTQGEESSQEVKTRTSPRHKKHKSSQQVEVDGDTPTEDDEDDDNDSDE